MQAEINLLFLDDSLTIAAARDHAAEARRLIQEVRVQGAMEYIVGGGGVGHGRQIVHEEGTMGSSHHPPRLRHLTGSAPRVLTWTVCMRACVRACVRVCVCVCVCVRALSAESP